MPVTLSALGPSPLAKGWALCKELTVFCPRSFPPTQFSLCFSLCHFSESTRTQDLCGWLQTGCTLGLARDNLHLSSAATAQEACSCLVPGGPSVCICVDKRHKRTNGYQTS